jgi:hypothetical protein
MLVGFQPHDPAVPHHRQASWNHASVGSLLPNSCRIPQSMEYQVWRERETRRLSSPWFALVIAPRNLPDLRECYGLTIFQIPNVVLSLSFPKFLHLQANSFCSFPRAVGLGPVKKLGPEHGPVKKWCHPTRSPSGSESDSGTRAVGGHSLRGTQFGSGVPLDARL